MLTILNIPKENRNGGKGNNYVNNAISQLTRSLIFSCISEECVKAEDEIGMQLDPKNIIDIMTSTKGKHHIFMSDSV